jgi:hypothetical protein
VPITVARRQRAKGSAQLDMRFLANEYFSGTAVAALIAAGHWRLDAAIRRQGNSAVVRTIWIVRTGESVPRFVTCWVL